MNIIILTGLYPTEDFQSGGSFIYERIRELQKTGVQYHVYAISRRYSIGMRIIYKYLRNNELKNHIVVPWNNRIRFTVIYDDINIPLFFISLIAPNLYWKLKKKNLLQKISITSDTIVHAHWAYPHGFFAVKLAQDNNLKSVITCHGSDIHSNPHLSPQLRKITVETIQSTDKTIFVSNDLLSSAKRLGYNGNNAVVIHNGTDIDKFYPIDNTIALENTGWKQTKHYVVGFVGSLISVKRADKFVEIFSEIQKRVWDVEFILVGDGDLAENISKECSQKGITVTITGRVSHEKICSWINLFDVMILPSRKESWGCVIQEAYACGVPVVGAKIGGIPENIGGICPIVEDGEDFEKRFADTVSRILTEDIIIDSEILTLHAKENTWINCINKEMEIYKKILQTDT